VHEEGGEAACAGVEILVRAPGGEVDAPLVKLKAKNRVYIKTAAMETHIQPIE